MEEWFYGGTGAKRRRLVKWANDHRSAPTEAEYEFYRLVRLLGLEWRRKGFSMPKLVRQFVFHNKFILDAFFPQIGLCVEIDGGYHKAIAKKDAKRDRYLAKQGVTVYRIKNEEVLCARPEAVATIWKLRRFIEKLPPNPVPKIRGATPGRRALGTNPRRLRASPRKLGTNPRATGVGAFFLTGDGNVKENSVQLPVANTIT